MGRNAQPIEILQANGRKHLTRAEIEKRKQSEIKVGDSKLKCPDFVKKDIVAYKKWKEILKIYKEVDFVSSGDTGLLARYCMTFSEYESLLGARERIAASNSITIEDKSEICADFALEGSYTIDQVKKIINIVEYYVSLNGQLDVETAINKKMDMLIKMEDRLFLNPLAKVKNVPKKQKDDNKPESKWVKFGAGKIG